MRGEIHVFDKRECKERSRMSVVDEPDGGVSRAEALSRTGSYSSVKVIVDGERVFDWREPKR